MIYIESILIPLTARFGLVNSIKTINSIINVENGALFTVTKNG